MRRLIKTVIAIAMGLTASAQLFAAPPKQLITHNLTNFESNAFIAGTIASPYPTKAHSDGKVFWGAVRMTCFGHIIDGKCAALIRIGTDTNNPIELGTVELNIETGAITPNMIHANGYQMVVNGLGETTITQE
jgi:hypothetical protein